MATHAELVGVYARRMWASPAGDYIIGQLLDGTTIKGQAQPGELLPNVAYKFFGRWQQSNNPKYPAPSFLFVAAVKDIPHNREAVVQYIVRSLKGFNTGIGEVKAHKLYDFYEADAVRQLRMNPSEVAVALRHDVSKCREASEILDRDKKFEDCKISLVEMFAGKGFGKKTIAEAIEKWGVRAASFVRRDPYLLLTNRINGAGFSRCDNLYLHLGGAPEKMKRQVLAGAEVMHKDMSGNTWHPISKAVDSIKAKVDGVNIDPAKAIKIGGKTKRFAFYLDDRFRTWIADYEHARSENDVARLATRLLSQPATWPTISDPVITNHQREKLAAATSGRIGILCGTPGTGKTFTAASLIRSIVEKHGDGSIMIAAPTGKAAVRISEAMANHGIDLRAKTIHRMLRPNDLGYGTGDWNFSCNESNPLEADFIIVDEASMISTDLMAGLIRATSLTAHILLIGDPYQLPPVGHGSPLRDLIAAGIPHGELTELKRNSGLIVDACRRIKDGVPFATCKKFDDDAGQNLMVAHVSSAAAAVGEIERIYRSIIASAKRDPFEDVQVLVALNDKGQASRKTINTFLQSMLNPSGETVDGCRYRVGDKIICLSNDGYPDAENAQLKHYICNGEMGRVVAVQSTHVEMEFAPDSGDFPRRIKVGGKGKGSSRDGGSGEKFDLAYAITVWKAQGSEWPVVLVVTEDAADRVACREYWYTAISRAKNRCLVVGSLATIGRQCRKVTLNERKTFLVEKLKPLLDGTPQAAIQTSMATQATQADHKRTIESEVPPKETTPGVTHDASDPERTTDESDAANAELAFAGWSSGEYDDVPF